MRELNIKMNPASGHDPRQVIEYVAGMIDVGMASGVLRDADGMVICEWGCK